MSTKCCFVVSQIGDDDSPERVHAEWFLHGIVKPVFEARAEFSVERADSIAHPGLIDAQIIDRLLKAEIVIADLTALNPNVFYEIGIRHMAQKPIIHMHEVEQKIPFDVSLYRSIQFSRRTPQDLVDARARLAQAVDLVTAGGLAVENPVTNARGRFQLEQSATPEQQILMQQMRALEQRCFPWKCRSPALLQAPRASPTLLIQITRHPMLSSNGSGTRSSGSGR